MKIKLILAWNGNEAGDVLDLDQPVADLLLERAIAVIVPGTEKPGAPQKVQPEEIKKKR